jgi:hypothetical protein
VLVAFLSVLVANADFFRSQGDFWRFSEILRDFTRFWEILRDFGRFMEILNRDLKPIQDPNQKSNLKHKEKNFMAKSTTRYCSTPFSQLPFHYVLRFFKMF